MESKPELHIMQNSIDEYYDVFNNMVDDIMKSQLLHEEDMQILNFYWREYQIYFSRRSLYSCSLLTILSGSVCTLYKCRIKIIAVATLIPSITYLLIKFKKHNSEKSMSNKMKNLINTLGLFRKLNLTVITYFEKRYSVLLSMGFKYESTIFSTFMSKQAKSFLFNYGKKLMNIVEVIKECIGNIRNCTKIREIDNYLISLEWNHEEFIFDEDDTMNGAIQKFQKLNGLFILITSNFLSCLGLSMCFDVWKIKCDIKSIFNNILPTLIDLMNTIYPEISNEFQYIRFSLQNTMKKEKRLAVTRLEQPLLDFLNQIQIIFEAGRFLEGKLREEQLNNVDNLTEYLESMCSQYEKSHTILTTMQKILIKHKKENTQNTRDNIECNSNVANEEKQKENTVIRYDDPQVELADEEYVLSTHGSDDEVETRVPDHYEDLLEQIAVQKLMIHELNTKLNAVRKKKGIEIDAKEEITKLDQDFAEKNICNLQSNTILTTAPQQKISSLPPPPPPPLPPERQIPKLTLMENASTEPDRTYIARAVKSFASQLNREEEVFSIDCEESE